MNKKYLLTTILVLLLITIGLSFSYFVSKTTQNNLEEVKTEAPTAKIPEFTLETKVDTPDSLPMYPGTKNYISAHVKGKKEGGEEGDTTEYQIKYKITGSVTIPEETEFTEGKIIYKLYKTTEEIETPITCKEVSVTQETENEIEIRYSQECTLNEKLTNEVTLTEDDHDGSIQSGTATFTYEDVIPADNKTIHYYYLVVEYPNEEKEQNLDMGKQVTYAINSIVSTETGIKEDLGKKSFEELTKLASANCLETGLTSGGVIDENGFTDTEEGQSSCKVYETEDNDGTSYYYRGAVQDNYVKFGKTGTDPNSGTDIWWRIIRINGDGSIRMIYAGTGETMPNQKQGSSTMINNGSTSYEFNTQWKDNMYVGFEYVSEIRNGTSKSEGGQKSNALQQLETWFEQNLKDELDLKDSKIDKNAGFCGDRSAYDWYTLEQNNELGIGTQSTRYGAYIRNIPNNESASSSNPAHPSYTCPDIDNDLYTYTGSNKGTKSLTYPIGLITTDEVTYAGGLVSKNNASYYLYNNSFYWTLSPSTFVASNAGVFIVNSDGRMFDNYVGHGYGLRPVLNLVLDSLISGDGTPSNPFKTVE